VTRVYTARWVLPISSAPVASGGVAVEGGRIVWVGPSANAPDGERVDLGDAAIIPGLVNTHTHLELTAMRGFLEGLDFRPWIVQLTRARQGVLTTELLLASARVGIAEGLLAGITTFADTSESGVVLRAMVESGVRGIMYQEVFGPDPAQASGAVAALRARLAELAPWQTPRVRLGVSPHAPYSVSDVLYREVATLAREEGWPMAVHLAESRDETSLVRDGIGAFADGLRARGIEVSPRADSPVMLLDRLGVLAERPLVIHAVQVSRPDVACLARHDCAVAHCPASNARLGHGIAPLGEFKRAGLRVGLGSDSVAANNRLDLLDEARVTLLLQGVGGDGHYVHSAASALDLATRGGAQALGLGGEIGALEVGRAADLAAFSLGSPRTAPSFAPEDALVWALSGRAATLVTVEGVELVRDGALVHAVDRELALVRHAAESLSLWRESGSQGGA